MGRGKRPPLTGVLVAGQPRLSIYGHGGNVGTQITLDLAGVSVTYSKNHRGIDHGSIFQEKDRKAIESNQLDYDRYEVESEYPTLSEMAFTRPLKHVVPRLELLGFNLERVHREYDAVAHGWLEERCTDPYDHRRPFRCRGCCRGYAEGRWSSCYDTLMSTLGPNWQGQVTVSPRPKTGSGSAEFYAVIYRSPQVQLCEGWSGLRYFTDNDGTPGSAGPGRFDREPAYTCLMVTDQGGDINTDFMLGVYHAVWGDGDEDEIRGEVEHIDVVFDTMAAANPNERDLLIVGDFNLTSSPLQASTQAEDRTEGTGSTLNSEGERTENLYDHLLVRDEAASQELMGNARVLEVSDRAADPRSFYRTVSDHLPVVARWNLAGGDDD